MDQLYTRNGAQGLNAGTWEDLTAYFVTLPSNRSSCGRGWSPTGC